MIIVIARGNRVFLIQQENLDSKVGIYTYARIILFYLIIVFINPDLSPIFRIFPF